MLTVFFGNDTLTIRTQAYACAEKSTDGANGIERYGIDNFNAAELLEAANAASLFGGKRIFLIDTISDSAEHFEALLAIVPTLAHSAHEFIIIEDELLTDARKQFTAVSSVLSEHKRVAEKGFEIFSLTEAFLLRDKKLLWLTLHEAWRAGLSTEEIIGTMFWQVKTVRLVSRCGSPEEAELKPFVFNKAKQALRRYTPLEIDEYSRALVTIYHEGHRGINNIDLALEAWVLTL